MIVFPSKNSWITPRNELGQVTTDNPQIILPQKISKIDKVYINLPDLVVNLVSTEVGDHAPLKDIYIDEKHTISLAELDITSYVVEKTIYDTLTTYNAEVMPTSFGPQYTNNTWYYQHNGTKIYLPNDTIKGNLQFKGHKILEFIITSAVYNYIYNNGKKDGKLYVTNFSAPTGYTTIGYSDSLGVIVPNSADIPDIRSVPFRIYYTPLGESVKLQVPKTNPQANQFCIPYNQQQPIVDNTTFGREMQSVANRTGCETKQVVRTIHNIRQYRRPKDGYYHTERDAEGNPTGNIWRLTAAHLTIYSETLMRVTETWSKNWSYRSENVPIDREFRSWNIPADIVQRNLLWQDYCLITRKNLPDGALPQYALLSNNAREELLRGLDGSVSGKNTECNNMWFYRNNGSQKYGVALNCSAFGFGNSLVFSGKTKDNLSAGVQREDSEGNGKYEFCKDVYYCDEDGTLDKTCIQVGSALYTSDDAQQEAAYKYPEFKIAPKTSGSVTGTLQWINAPAPSLANGINLFKDDEKSNGEIWNEFTVLKDPSEQINFTYQLHLLTDDGRLIIGSTWAASNPLVKQRDKEQTIKVWKLSHPLPQGAQVMTTAYGEEQQSDLFSVNISDANPTIMFNSKKVEDAIIDIANDGKGACVTDENNNILIAFNDNKPATFSVKFTHDYNAIYAAINNN